MGNTATEDNCAHRSDLRSRQQFMNQAEGRSVGRDGDLQLALSFSCIIWQFIPPGLSLPQRKPHLPDCRWSRREPSV